MSRLDDLRAHGRHAAALQRADPRRALDVVLPLLAETWVLDYDGYDDWLMTAGDAFADLGKTAERGFTRFARHDLKGALADQPAHSMSAAFLHEANGSTAGAAEIYRRRGKWALAAYAFEAAGEDATDAWQAAIAAYPPDVDPIGNGLAWLGLAQWLLPRDLRRARTAMQPGLMGLARLAVQAEEAADLEAAARHYALMAEAGHALGSTEHLLEGAVNAARVLTGLTDLQAAMRVHLLTATRCVELAEPHAAALSFQDAARLADSHDRQRAPIYWQAAAECWGAAATTIDHLPAGFAENALLARVDALNRIGAGARVRATLVQLEMLPLRPDRTAHYAQLRAQLGAGVDAPQPPLMGSPKPTAPPRFAGELAARELGDDLQSALLEQSVHAPSPALRRDAMAALLSFSWDALSGRARAAAVLAQGDGEVAWVALMGLLASSEPAVRNAGLAPLASRGERRVVRALLAGLGDDATYATAHDALLTRRRPAGIGLLASAARRPGPAATPAVEALALLGEDALDSLWQVSQARRDSVGAAALFHFQALCPRALRGAWQ
ncbi:MAG: hypothetical protein ACI9U2_002190 [Bradymonadia bacterium]